MTEQLFSLTRLKCECATEAGIHKLDKLLREAQEILKDKRSKGAIKKMEMALEVIRMQHKQHMRFRGEYARDLVDLVKSRALNVGPSQQKLQTIPYLVGKEKRDRDQELQDKKKKKKRRV